MGRWIQIWTMLDPGYPALGLGDLRPTTSYAVRANLGGAIPSISIALKCITNRPEAPPICPILSELLSKMCWVIKDLRRRVLDWWNELGQPRYPDATRRYIASDRGGSNSAVSRLYQVPLQTLADATGLEIHGSHYPPGTRQWNPIEPKLFSAISHNWRAQPLLRFSTVVNFIAHTTTATGLKVKAILDPRIDETGTKVSDAALAAVNIERAAFQGQWNDVIKPHPPAAERA